MGRCRYCNESAGFFSSEHAECKQKHDEAPSLLASSAEATLGGRMSTEAFAGRVRSLQQDFFLRPDEIRPVVAAAMSKAADKFLQDGLLTEEEEKLLSDVQAAGGLTTRDMDIKDLMRIRAQYGFSRWDYAAQLRDIIFKPKDSLESRRSLGKLMAEETQIGSPFTFRLAEDEYLGDIQDAIVYSRTEATRQYVGGSQGVSVRLGPGLYYRVGAFRGQAVEQTQLARIDIGRFAYSNRALYFWGDRERLRIAIDQILSHEAGDDSITIWRDRANSKPEVFSGDIGFGWYIANVIANIGLMDKESPPPDGNDRSRLKIGAEL